MLRRQLCLGSLDDRRAGLAMADLRKLALLTRYPPLDLVSRVLHESEPGTWARASTTAVMERLDTD